MSLTKEELMTIERSELELFHSNDISIETKTIYFGSPYADRDGEIDARLTEKFLKNFHLLDREIHPEGITIILNQIGGEAYHGLAIYDEIISANNKITVIVKGNCHSMAVPILQAADTRLVSENATLMIHSVSSGFYGTYYQLLDHVKETKRLNDLYIKMILKSIKKKNKKFTKKDLEELIKKDTYFTARQALSLGLCDKILKNKKKK